MLMINTDILCEFNPIEPSLPVKLFDLHIGHYTVGVSNHMFMITLAGVVLLILMPYALYSKKLRPRGFSNMIEAICVYLRDDMVRPSLGEYTDKFIGFVWTMFFFILTLNLLGLVPTEKIIYLITHKKNHYGGPATANIWITGAMAMVTFFVTHIVGIKKQGLWHYIKHFAPKVPILIYPFIFFLEILSAIIRPFSLAVRLFANIFAGHTMTAVMILLILIFKNYYVASASVAVMVAISLLELLVAFVQAYIFTLLSTLFISFSLASEH